MKLNLPTISFFYKVTRSHDRLYRQDIADMSPIFFSKKYDFTICESIWDFLILVECGLTERSNSSSPLIIKYETDCKTTCQEKIYTRNQYLTPRSRYINSGMKQKLSNVAGTYLSQISNYTEYSEFYQGSLSENAAVIRRQFRRIFTEFVTHPGALCLDAQSSKEKIFLPKAFVFRYEDMKCLYEENGSLNIERLGCDATGAPDYYMDNLKIYVCIAKFFDIPVFNLANDQEKQDFINTFGG